ncbi:MAG: hypothetical protein Athens041674_49 [Parcubacteria group bacterium Athens0416_74]|nr:MAG: hypothetical protein Athens041674_49 [Parcubacteria group bacterium Athens0416_74]
MDFSSISQFIASAYASISIDWIIFGGVALFLSFDALRAGPARVTALAIALPIALLLSESIHSAAYIGAYVEASSAGIQTGVFIALTAGLFIALYRIVDFGADSMRPVQALIVGLACAVVVTIVFLQLPDTTVPWSFGDAFEAVFSDTYRLYWLLSAYFALAVARA